MGSALAPSDDMAGGEVPVTVLSGFLGSGKTTLLRALLSSGHVAPSSVGLIINDLAEVNVDARLVNAGLNGAEAATVSAASEEVHGACACCSGREDLNAILDRLAQRTPPLSHIILECSGMSDPRNIVRALLLPQAPAQGSTSTDQDHPDTTCRHPVLSSVVTVLDSSALAAWISSGESFQEAAQELNRHEAQQNISQLLMLQIECASLVVLHKVDRVSVAQLSACVHLVRTLNPLATRHCVKFGVLDPSEILQPKVSYHRMMAAWLQRLGPNVTSTRQSSSAEGAPSSCAPAAEAPPLGSMGQAPAAAVEAPETEACCGCASSEGSQQQHSHNHTCQEQTNKANRANKASKAIIPGSVRSFVFRSRRPFHPDRLQLLIRQIRKEMAQLDGHAVGVTWQGARGAGAGAGAAGATGGVGEGSGSAEGSSGVGFMRGVLRSKGLVWVAPHMDVSREWSQTRGVFELQRGQPWEEKGAPPVNEESSNSGISEEDGLGPELVFGARRQEVVFIGTDTMDESRIRADLGACLLDDVNSLWAQKVGRSASGTRLH